MNADMISGLTYSFQSLCGPVFYSYCNRNEYQENVLRCNGARCVQLTALPHSYAECPEIQGSPNSCNPMCFSRPVQRLLYLSIKIPDVIDPIYVTKEVDHMKSIERVCIYKWATNNNQLCNKLNDSLRWSS